MTACAPRQGAVRRIQPIPRPKSFRRARAYGFLARRRPVVAVNFALSAAKVRARTARREARSELREAASSWRERRENDLREMGVVIPLSDWLGHNNGPDILESPLFKEWRWRKVRDAAFEPPDAET